MGKGSEQAKKKKREREILGSQVVWLGQDTNHNHDEIPTHSRWNPVIEKTEHYTWHQACREQGTVTRYR